MTKETTSQKQQVELRWLDRPIHPSLPAITNEIILFAGIILLAIVTRFYNLGARVMSHDESLHSYFSWLLYRGNGYEHNPMMHGPIQFFFPALSYFLFGASDFTARTPAALFSIATVCMALYWRRYLGKTGGLVAGLLMVISPIMLYYGRYIREDPYAVFSGVLMLYVVLRYFETGAKKYLYWLAVALFIHFTAKETSFIYAAQLLLFLAIYFIARVTRRMWDDILSYRGFIIMLAIGILLLGVGAGLGIASAKTSTLGATEVAAPANPSATASPLGPVSGPASPALFLVGGGLVAIVIAAFFLIRGFTWEGVKAERSFSMLILTGTLVLPMVVPFPIKLFEESLKVKIPTNASEVQSLTSHDVMVVGAFMLGAFLITILIGMLWDRDWWKMALTFWVPFTVFYTTIFTNTDGFFTGVVGSLGYWLVQQGVQRGSQPWYYYLLIQIPIYEFLPLLGVILALIIGLRRRFATPTETKEASKSIGDKPVSPEEENFPNTFALLVWWVFATIASLSIAGEKMPWLTIHIAWPMILLTGWGLGALIDKIDWENLRQRRILLVLGVVFVFFTSLSACLIALLGFTPPFQGNGLQQLQATGAFLLPAVVAVASAGGLVYLLRDWTGLQAVRAFTLTFFALLAVLTVRASFRASYINYDNAMEYLVYAHGATGVKDVINQAAEISKRTTGGMGVNIAYDASAPDTGVSWPFVWYLRDFTNQHSFDQPTRALRDSTIVIVDSKNFDKIEQALGPGYYRIDYIRMWWPNQDYFNLTSDRGSLFNIGIQFADTLDTGQLSDPIRELFQNQGRPLTPTASVKMEKAGNQWLITDGNVQYEVRKEAFVLSVYNYDFPKDYPCNGALGFFKLFKTKDFSRICSAIIDPNIRAGIIDIWLNRDYTVYAQVTGHSDLTLATWQPSDEMRMYIKKDVAQEIWKYGALPSQQTTNIDPYQGKTVTLNADQIIDATKLTVPMNAPRSLAVAPDGTLYVADSRNHRILHFDASGTLINQFGSPTGNDPNNPNPSAPPSTFNEPWGVAVGPDGSVYVTDTWNHRVQKFTAAGQFVKTWGTFGQGSAQDTFYGPRGIAVDAQGRVYVVDTGNKRVVVFDADGNYVTQFGSEGLDAGQFDEPVGIAIDSNGIVYVTDTWNQRIQSFAPAPDGLSFTPLKQWDVAGWYGQSLDNKPFIAVDNKGHVFVTDPEGYRVIEYTTDGQLIQTWGDYGITTSTFGIAAGVAVDAEGHVWVTDAGNNRIMRFTLP